MPEGGTGERDLMRLWLEGSRAFLNANADAAELWPQCERLFRTWAKFYEGVAGVTADRVASGQTNPFDPAGWLRAEGEGGMADLSRWFEGPELAGVFEEYRAGIRQSREWMAYQTALDQHRAVTARGWLRAFERFVDAMGRKLGGTDAQGSDKPGWTTMRDLWRKIADVELAEMQRSDEFLAAQRDLIRTQIDLRAALRSRAEGLAEMIGLPTRAELDDLHETLHELRQEIAQLRAARRNAGDA